MYGKVWEKEMEKKTGRAWRGLVKQFRKKIKSWRKRSKV